jgi:hypothetical protein
MLGRRTVLGGLAAAGALARAAAAGPKPKSAPADLTGTWTNAWYTKLERPKDFKGLIATPAEAEAYEAPRRKMHGEVVSKDDEIGQNESEFPDNGPGLARIAGQPRSSWIVDPPDGRIPWIAAAKERLHVGGKPPEVFEWFDNPEQRDTEERCLTAPGMGPPIVNSHDGNLFEIVQTAGWLAILGEKNHDLRIIELPGAPPAGGPVPPDPWHGRSLGRWEGASLVVETAGFRPGLTKVRDGVFLSDRARVVERFTRNGEGEILYGYTVEDATLFTRPWRAEVVFRRAEGLLYEYACHEGNYGLPDILRAARRAEAAKAQAGGR